MADSIQDPFDRQAKLYGAYKQTQEAKQLKDQEDLLVRKKDPNSNESRALKQIAPRWGIKVAPEMSAYEIEQMIDPRKMMETEAASRVNFENQKALKAMDNAADIRKYQMERELKKEDKAAEENKKLETIYGVARTEDDAKKIKEAGEQKAKLDSQISELITLRKEKGAELLNRDVVARAQQLSKDLLLTKKNLENLGVLSQSDRDIVDEIIPSDPTQFHFSQMYGQDPTLTKLERFKDDTNRDFQERLKNRVRGYQPPPQEFAQDVLDYAKKHGIAPAQAQAIKDQRTAGQTAKR
jgi:hypothetical protein